MTTIDKLFDAYPDAAGFASAYFGHLYRTLTGVDLRSVAAFIHELEQAADRGSTVFFAGNGGSAATASHFAVDLGAAGRATGKSRFKSISLATNTAAITALANDHGYEAVFTGQMLDLFNAGDVLVAISASGNSRNILAAVRLAKERGGRTVALVGFDGGALLGSCDVVVHVPSKNGDYGPVEDAHLVLDHLVTSYLSLRLRRKGSCV